MMTVWSEGAMCDLEQIYEFVLMDRPSAAQRLVDSILEAADSLGTMPLRGRRLFGTDLRELILAPLPYILRYSVEPEHILITAVRHGAMQEERRIR